MTTFIIIGNAFALLAAVFTILSSFSRTRKKIYGYQMLQCLIMVVASLFFNSFSGAVTILLCAIRNGFLMFDRFSGKLCIVFSAAVIALGLASNNRGWVGLIPIITTVIYTIGSYYLKREIPIKINIVVNLALWAVYDAMVLDLVSCSIDAVSSVATIFAIYRDRKISIIQDS